MRYLNDHWTKEIHLLGRENFALAVRDLILEADTPFALSIGGRWGMGKTSMLRALMASLGGEPIAARSAFGETKDDTDSGDLPDALVPEPDKLKNIRTVWFNPWQNRHEGNPLIPLLHEIREQIRWYYQQAGKEKIAATALTEAGLHTIGDLISSAAAWLPPLKPFTAVGTFAEKYVESKARQQKEHFATVSDAQRFFLQFEKAVWQLVDQDPRGRLVIFIDDLDRCQDDTVLDLLEAIKLYLSSRHCVFVFGLDAGHVENAIVRAGSGRLNYREAAQYVEKLFQTQLNLPIPRDNELQSFMGRHLRTLGISNADTDRGAANHQVAKTLLRLLPANPRLIKNTLNGLKLHHDLLKKLRRKRDWQPLLLVHLFRTFYPDAYELLVQDPAAVLATLRQMDSEGGYDPADHLQAYLHRIIANPVYRTLTPKGEVAPPAMDDDLFRQVRAGVWRAKAMHEFMREFTEVFGGAAEIEGYLV